MILSASESCVTTLAEAVAVPRHTGVPVSTTGVPSVLCWGVSAGVGARSCTGKQDMVRADITILWDGLVCLISYNMYTASHKIKVYLV